MKIRMMTMAAVAATVIAAPALAQSPAGSPADPNSAQNRQMGPNAGTPTDPAAGSNPGARVPTAPNERTGASEGAASGEAGAATSGGSGSATSPAGIPADPNSPQNRQMGPNAGTPTDPAAGSKPSARVPTAP